MFAPGGGGGSFYSASHHRSVELRRGIYCRVEGWKWVLSTFAFGLTGPVILPSSFFFFFLRREAVGVYCRNLQGQDNSCVPLYVNLLLFAPPSCPVLSFLPVYFRLLICLDVACPCWLMTSNVWVNLSAIATMAWRLPPVKS